MLTAHGLAKRYNGQPVLHPAELAFAPGEAVGVAGANGSGKSTLLSILAQAMPQTPGTSGKTAFRSSVAAVSSVKMLAMCRNRTVWCPN